MANRIDRINYYLQMAQLAAKRSTCLRLRCGAVIVKDDSIVSTGYNGSPRGMAHCLDLGCERDAKNIPHGERYEICRSVHAEANAIIQAAKHGVSVDGATMYVTGMPCFMCAKMIVNAGIKKVIISKDQKTPSVSDDFFRISAGILYEGGVVLEQWTADAAAAVNR